MLDPQGGTTTYTYDPLSLTDTVTLPNGIVTDYTYNNRYQVTGILQHRGVPTIPLAQYDYTYDAAGNRVGATEVVDGDTTTLTYRYDDAYRLMSESRVTNGVPLTTSFTYDDVGNRLTETVGNSVTHYTYNELDQLTQQVSEQATLNYTYDLRGNLIQQRNVTLNQTSTYGYDALNRLTSVQQPGAAIAYEYDPAGHRIEQSTNGTETRYLWDAYSRFGDVIAETDSSNVVTMSYVYADCGCANGNQLISQTAGDETHYRLADAQGSTRLLTDESGAVTSSYTYDVFGELLSTGTLETKYLYTGQRFDAETDLYSLRARYYNPSVGRFLSRDTWAYNTSNPFELNRYVYTANNPVNYTDPTGFVALGERVSVDVENKKTAPAAQALTQGRTTIYIKEGNVIRILQPSNVYYEVIGTPSTIMPYVPVATGFSSLWAKVLWLVLFGSFGTAAILNPLHVKETIEPMGVPSGSDQADNDANVDPQTVSPGGETSTGTNPSTGAAPAPAPNQNPKKQTKRGPGGCRKRDQSAFTTSNDWWDVGTAAHILIQGLFLVQFGADARTEYVIPGGGKADAVLFNENTYRQMPNQYSGIYEIKSSG